VAYNTKNILHDGTTPEIRPATLPIPQIWSPADDDFKPLAGTHLGSGRYGMDSLIWVKKGEIYVPLAVDAEGKLQVGGSVEVSSLPDVVVLSLAGSNTRKTATATVTIGTGAAHSAGDVVSTDAGEVLEFDTGLPAGNSGIILDSVVTLDHNAVFAGGLGYELHLFTVSPAAQATNAVFNLASGELANYIGKIDISTLRNHSSNCAATDKGHSLSFTLAAGDTKLYGKAVCIGSETTVSAKAITFNLGIMAL
jgi:hypothetical protein